MAAYKDLVGQKITKVTSNPGEPKTGQMWYNSTDGSLRGLGVVKAWVSAAPVITARRTAASVGTQTANFIAGGFIPGFVASTEEYNGTGWTAGGDMPASSYAAFGAGTQTAGLVYGGSTDPGGQEGITTTIEYNGSSWTSGGALNQKRWSSSSGAGTQTAALCSSGYNDGNVTNSEEYNGSSWTAGNAIDTAKRAHGQCGTQTASVLFGGLEPPGSRVATVEEYDGTNYSSATSLPGTRSDMGASGTQTAALGFAGYIDPGRSNNAFSYDGTSWTAQPNLATAIDGGGGSRGGTSIAALSSTGTAPPGLTSATEEFTQSTNTITAAAWASGGALNQARYQMAGCGTLTAGLAFGGYEPGGETGKTEEYDGTSFSEQNDMGTARYEMGNGNGTQTAALCSAGRTDTAHGGGAQAFVEEYDGTSWSEVNNLPGNRTAHGSAGPQTASIIALGKSAPPAPSVVTTSLHYDGTNWTSGGSTNTARFAAFGAGTQTSAIFAGGNPSLATAEEYNGSAWTTTGSLIAGAQGPSAAGADSDAALFTSGGNGGESSGVAQTSSYNGTVFVSAPQLASERGYAAGFGIQTSAVVAGGLRSTGVTTTEEFTGETTAANITDFTTS